MTAPSQAARDLAERIEQWRASSAHKLPVERRAPLEELIQSALDDSQQQTKVARGVRHNQQELYESRIRQLNSDKANLTHLLSQFVHAHLDRDYYIPAEDIKDALNLMYEKDT